MATDAKYKESLIAAIDLKFLFNSAQLGFSKLERNAIIKPNKEEIDAPLPIFGCGENFCHGHALPP